MGLDAVKFFPAVPSGGLSMIKALAAPYHTMRFMPTGGVTPQNLTEFLDYPKILACGGTWMVKPELLATGNFEEISRLTRQTVRTMLDLKIDELTLPFPHTGNNLSDALHGLINLSSGSTKELTISCRYLKRTIYHLEKTEPHSGMTMQNMILPEICIRSIFRCTGRILHSFNRKTLGIFSNKQTSCKN